MGSGHLGQRVRMLREQRRGHSLRDAEAATGLHYTYLSLLERQQEGPLKATGSKIVTLARYLGVTTDYLLGIEDSSTELILRQRLAEFKPAELRAFQQALRLGGRLGAILTWLREAGRDGMTIPALSETLGFPEADFRAVIECRAEPSDYLLDKVCQHLGIPRRLVEYGDFGPPPQLMDRIVNHPDSEEYLRAVADAMDNGISPRSFAHIVKSFIAQKESPR